MWSETKGTDILGIEYPIIQAGMAGGYTSPQLVAAVSNAGGLGSLGAGYLTPEQIHVAVHEIRSLTDKPFAVNLFIPGSVNDSPEKIGRINALMQPYRNELGLKSAPHDPEYKQPFEDQIAVLLEEKVPVFSFTFGIPSNEIIEKCKNNGITLIGTATTVHEAVKLEACGIDMIVGQGFEAGGHRGTFLHSFEDSLVGTMALIPQLVDRVTVPVIASGGIMDGRGIAAALALGASGVQMGTAFLTCEESMTHEKHKEALLSSADESTTITRAFSGKPARGIKNKFIVEMAEHTEDLPAYPIQNALTQDIRRSAAKRNITDYMSMWAGQASALCTTQSAGQLVAHLVEQTEQVFANINK
ncbi:NAD(P)H-dependent flavin oxidoreductase [Aneurinibacillus terranovensis]|uniref:NAD(P)H-dependent flavin oxidoreductase n=1 Tax=Aneurinibacillus terranovensis TaxID=278991 RepID=UPI0003FCD3D9|nr:nitronate monooxygenase [Aneurinibacillus terranovensis]